MNGETINPKSYFKTWFMVIMGFFYFGQGYSLTSLVFLLWIYIRDELGVATKTEAVGLAGLIVIPWYIKFIFGMLSDYFPIGKYGRRKPYFVLAAILSTIGWLTLGLHESVTAFFMLSGLCLATGSAISDAVIDGLAVEITPKEFIGRMQGVAWGSRGLGVGITSVVSAQIVSNYGWQLMFNVSAFFGISISVIVLILPQGAPLDFEGLNRLNFIKLSFKEIFSMPRTGSRVMFFFLTGMVLSVKPLISPIMEDNLGYEISLIGWGTLSLAIGSFIGAISYGMMSDWNDTFSRFVKLSGAVLIAMLLGIFVDVSTGWNSTFRLFGNLVLYARGIQFAFFFIIGLFTGAYEAYQLKVIQEESFEHFEGTTFGLWTGLSNLGQLLIADVLILFISESQGIPILLAMQILIIPVMISAVLLSRLKFDDKPLPI